MQDAGGCQATLDEMLGEPVAVTLVLDPQDPGCNQVCGGAASATAGGGVAGYTYTWSGGVAGNVADGDARAVRISVAISTLAPVDLVFAWSRRDDIPLIFGQTNFFMAFDVCFFRSRGYFIVSTHTDG